MKSERQGRKLFTISYALPETAASVAIAATVVGAAATLLIRRTKAAEVTEVCNQLAIIQNGDNFLEKY